MIFNYFNLENAIKVHDDIVKNSGGLLGIRDQGILESILDFVQNDFYYPNIEDKLTYLLFSLNKNHCFVDGNKRASLSLSAYFLVVNKIDFMVPKFIETFENIAVDIANNVIDKELLQELVYSFIYKGAFSEELQLKIIEAKLFHLNNINNTLL